MQPGGHGAARDIEDRADFIDPVALEVVQSDHRTMLRTEATQRVLDGKPIDDRLITRYEFLGVSDGNPASDSSPAGEADGLIARDSLQPRLGADPNPKAVTMTKGLLKRALHGVGSIVAFPQNDQG
jgi:hypothetical protein